VTNMTPVWKVNNGSQQIPPQLGVNYPTLLSRWRGFLEGGASCFDDALYIHNIRRT